MSVLILCSADTLKDSPPAENCMSRPDGLRTRLAEALTPKIEEIEFCGSVPQFVSRFRRSQIAPSALILVIDTQDTLDALISVRDLFDSIPAIVVLTGEDPQIQHLSHTLGPRYIGYDDDLGNVVTVLGNIVAREL